MADCPVDHKGEFDDDKPNTDFVRRGDLVLKGVDESPEIATGSEATNALREEIGTKFFKLIQLPADFLAKVPAALQKFYNPVVAFKNEVIHKRLPAMQKRWKSIRKEFGIKPDEDPLLIDHIRGLEGNSNGEYTQTLEGADPRLTKAAIALRKRVFSAVFMDVKGYDERVAAKMREMGLEATEEHIKPILEVLRGGLPSKLTPEHLAIADWIVEEGKDRVGRDGKVIPGKKLVDLDPSYDVTGRFDEGYVTLMPIDNELAVLQNDMNSIQAMLQGGLLTPDEAQAQMTILQKKQARFTQVQQEITERLNRDFPRMETLPRRHFSEFFNEIKRRKRDATGSSEGSDLGADFDFVKDMDKIIDRYLSNAYHKRFFDNALFRAREVLPQIADPDVRAYITTWLNAIRGIRGFLEDRFVVDAVNGVKRFFGKQQSFTEDDLRKVVSEVMKFQALSKLFISPRFTIVNSTQSFMTVYPLVGGRIFGRSFAKAMAPIWEAITKGEVTPFRLMESVYKSPAWLRARAAGVIGQADRYLIESESANVRGFERVLSAVPTFAEDFNRVLAYNAGIEYMKTNGGKAHPLLKTFFVPEGKSNATRRLHAHGRAMVETTQFMFGTEGRPIGFVGGSARRLTTQFKTFSVAYGTLMKDTIKYGRRTGDWKPYGRMLGTLWFFGGVPAVAAGATFGASASFYEEVRNWLIRDFGFAIPRGSGLSSVLERFNLGGISPIDVTSSIEPYSMPKRPGEILPFLLGPTLGSGYRVGAKLKEEGMVGGVEAAASAISPMLSSVGRAGREYAEGGLFSPAGELQARPSGGQMLAEGLGTRPPTRVNRNEFMRDIEEALVGGNEGLAREMTREAKRDNIIIGPRSMASLRGRVTKRKKENKRSLLEELYK